MERENRPAPKAPTAKDTDGIDVSLIRWMLSLTPRERLELLQRHIASVEALRIRR